MNYIKKIPKVSIITAFLNGEAFLDQSIESILNQSFTDFEFIIIDDCSKDNSESIVKKYMEKDNRIIYIKNKERMDKVYNLNLGIDVAQADIIAIFDGDDVSEKNRIEKQYNFLINNPEISIVGSFVKIIDENGVIIDERTKPTNTEEIFKNAIVYSPLLQPSVMYRKDVIKKIGGYREKFRHGQDMDLWLRVVYSGYKVTNIPEYLLKYRYHKNSTAHTSVKNAIGDYKMRKDAIKNFNIKIGIYNRILIYIQLIIGVCLSGRQRQNIEGLYKKILYGRK